MSGCISPLSDDGASCLPRKIRMWRVGPERISACEDAVAAEEPLDIRISYYVKDRRTSVSFALAMRSPGADVELVAGLLLSEGVITRREDLVSLRYLGSETRNEMLAELRPGLDVETWRLRRSTALNSSCGACGKAAWDQIVPAFPVSSRETAFTVEKLLRLPSLLAQQQSGFAETGGLHAAALVNTAGEIEHIFEDIGRHNALDKLIGWCLLHDRLPLSSHLVFLTSRSSFELVQKTAVAGGIILATVGSPSSLAIETARSLDMTLIGFVRDGRCNVYSGERRLNSK